MLQDELGRQHQSPFARNQAKRRAAPDLPPGKALLNRQEHEHRLETWHHKATNPTTPAPPQGQARPSDNACLDKSGIDLRATRSQQRFHQNPSRLSYDYPSFKACTTSPSPHWLTPLSSSARRDESKTQARRGQDSQNAASAKAYSCARSLTRCIDSGPPIVKTVPLTRDPMRGIRGAIVPFGRVKHLTAAVIPTTPNPANLSTSLISQTQPLEFITFPKRSGSGPPKPPGQTRPLCLKSSRLILCAASPIRGSFNSRTSCPGPLSEHVWC